MILAGDVGGTNARLALFDGGVRVRQGSFASAEFASLEEIVRTFLGPSPPVVEAATFGIAGPVVGGRAKVTNLPWTVDERALEGTLGIGKVTLLNDLVALAYGALTVAPERLRVVSGGGPPQTRGANIAVIAAGTGLGEAALIWDGARLVPCATEGGHADFAPRNRLEFELLEFLQARHGDHVSYERVVAGPGFGALYDFFVEVKGVAERPEIAARIAAAVDRNKEIAALGAAGESAACARALETFASLYGAEAGNFALKTFATGGVFVCGGIAASYADALVKGGFVTSFGAKGRFTTLLARIPIAIVLDADIGLAGSAYHAGSTREARTA